MTRDETDSEESASSIGPSSSGVERTHPVPAREATHSGL